MKKPNFEAVIKHGKRLRMSELEKQIDRTNRKLVGRKYWNAFNAKYQGLLEKYLRSKSKEPHLNLHMNTIVGYNIPKEKLPMITGALKHYIEKVITPCSDGKHDWLPMPYSPPLVSVWPGRGFTLYCTKCNYRRIMAWTSSGFIKYVFKPYKDNPSRISEEIGVHLEFLMNRYGRGFLIDAVSEIDKKIKRLEKKYPKTENRIKKLEELKSFCYVQANLYL